MLKEKWEWQWKRGLERRIVNETGCEKKIGKGMEEREWRKRIGDERGWKEDMRMRMEEWEWG